MNAVSKHTTRTVVVVHGLWMTGLVFALQRSRLKRLGYRVVAFSYPSIRSSLDDVADRLAALLRSLEVARVHLIGHSLGGLAVLHMLGRDPAAPVGRVVLLASPCAGSIAADQLARSGVGRALLGKALVEWRPETGIAAAGRFEIGSIAGTLGLGIGQLLVPIPKPNDGVVCPHETLLPGFRDHLTMRVSHSGMLTSTKVMRQMCHFLEHGQFAHV